MMISSAGDHARGVELAKKANALNADSATGWYHTTVYTADYLNGDYESAAEVARQNQDQEMFYSNIEIIPIYGQLGRKKDASDAWQALLKQYPGASAKTFEDWWRLWNIRGEEVARLMEHLRARDRQAHGRRPQIRRAGCGGQASTCHSLYFRLGKLNSAPLRIPAGQRAVTVLRRV